MSFESDVPLTATPELDDDDEPDDECGSKRRHHGSSRIQDGEGST